MVEASAQTNAWIKFLMHTAECVFTGHHWSRGATDNASDYGSEDCRFESCRDRNFILFYQGNQHSKTECATKKAEKI